MSKRKVYLGIDLGASSGRAVLGFVENNRLKLREINRFRNGAVRFGGSLYWNIPSLWDDILRSMKICSELGYDNIAGIGIDSWGVDFGLLGKDNRLIGLPLCYRDSITDGAEKIIASALEKNAFFQLTGMKIGRVSSLAQLVGIKNGPSRDRLRIAETFLMIPDLFRYFLCGHKAVGISSAGSSLLTNIHTGKWSSKIFKSLHLPQRIMPEIVPPATVVGKLLPRLSAKTHLKQTAIIAVTGHDTCSAAAALPVVEPDCAFINCGTWSVMGVLRQEPITTPKALKLGFVNEFGLDSILFVRNMMGLYLFENFRRSLLRKGKKYSYAQMVRAAEQAKPFKAMLNLNAPLFFVSDDPEQSVKTFLKKTGQRSNLETGEIIRILLEGMVFSYRETLANLEEVTDQKYRRICMIGGGVRDSLLCQIIADALGMEVLAGTAEATVAGNLAAQALAVGQLQKPADIKQLMINSFKIKKYQPQSTKEWDRKDEKYQEIVRKSKNI